MSASLLWWVTLALCIFWGVGLYNRLMRMRARGLSALGSVEKNMRLYADLVRVHVTQHEQGNSHNPALPVERFPDRWSRLLNTLQALDQALKEDGATTLAPAPLARLGEAFDSVQRAWQQLNDLPPDLAGPVVPVAMHAQWEVVAQRIDAARDGFNQILIKYNEALDQFPARLVVALMGFKPGGML